MRAIAGTGASVAAASAEQLPYPDQAFDAVICSAVLCSVTDQAVTLRELRRVLRPGGSLEFFEHIGSAPGSWSRRLQRAIAPISRLLDGGCDPARDTIDSLQESPFAIEKLDRRRSLGPFGLETILISGRAR